jgi:hypothetical protein
MSWFTDPNCEAAAALEHAQLAYAVDFDFPSGHVRLHTGSGDLVVAGNTYTGVGSIGSIQGNPERLKLGSEKWSYSLSGVDPSVIPESEIDNSFGRSVVEYEVWMNPATNQVAGYEINREGRIDGMRRRDGVSPVIMVSVENRLVILDQADGWRYTGEHQAQFFPGDLGCDETKNLESKEVIWGGKRVDVDAGYRGRNYRGPGG